MSVEALVGLPERRRTGVWIVRLAVLGLVAAGLWWLHDLLSDPSKLPRVQRIVLIEPAPPPPPPPPEKLEEPEEEVEKISPDEVVNIDPGPKVIDDTLGLDSEGEAGADSFGLAGKPGGRDITLIGPGGSGSGSGGPKRQSFFDWAYANDLKQQLETALNRHPELRTRSYRTTIDLWVDPKGNVTQTRLISASGVSKLDEGIRAVLAEVSVGKPPPANLQQPIRIIVNAKTGGFG